MEHVNNNTPSSLDELTNPINTHMRMHEIILEFFPPKDGSEDHPRIVWHMITEHVASIDNFDVPEGQRGNGVGTAYYGSLTQ